LAKEVIPSDSFFSNVHPIGDITDPWLLEQTPDPRRPYRKRDGQATVVMSFRMPDHMHNEMKRIVEQRVIPGIESYADFQVDACAFYLSRFHELGISGFSGFKTFFDNDMRRHRSEDNRKFLDHNDEVIDMLVKDHDLWGMQETLDSLREHRDNLTKEPQPFRERFNKQIDRLESLIAESKE
jgi:hypothetical protein